MIKRKVFITCHHANQNEVDNFIKLCEGHFSDMRKLGVSDSDDFINSGNTEYVLRRIREKYITGTSATIALIGKCSWARKYID